MTASELGLQLGVAPKTVRRHGVKGPLRRELIHSGGRTLTVYRQDCWGSPDPDLMTGAS